MGNPYEELLRDLDPGEGARVRLRPDESLPDAMMALAKASRATGKSVSFLQSRTIREKDGIGVEFVFRVKRPYRMRGST